MRGDDPCSSPTPTPTETLAAFIARLRLLPDREWVDEVRRDQAHRWKSGNRLLLEDYFQCCPQLIQNEEDKLVLIVGEALLRRRMGQEATVEDYQRRFPQLASRISVQFDLDQLWTNGNTNRGIRVICSVCHIEVEQPLDSITSCPACGASPPPPQAADLLPADNSQRRLGKYELVAPVGAGAFGIVYKARDSELDRIVAIKVPRAMHLSATEDLERFLREAKSVAQLRHPSIVTVHDVGQADQTPFLVSEFVEGTTLADLLSTRRPALRQTAELVATVADALNYAHEMGVVHRDVKPANVMLDATGAPRLMDFGLARRDAGDATMTSDGHVMGTPAYMSPEQARGESRNVDGRSDLYSLGVILYQLLTGQLPFSGSAPLLLQQLLHDEPPRPRSVNHLVPRDLETICLKAMAKEARGRYTTARDMADDLRRFLKDEPIQARSIGRAERVWRWCRRKPALASLSSIVVILLLAIALGGTAVVSILLGAIAIGGTLAAVQFGRQARNEKLLRSEADENLYYQRILSAHLFLTDNLPHPARAEELLNACPADRRNWEWDYLKGLWQTEPVVLSDANSGKFRGVAFSHDGSQLAAASGDGKIRVWDQKTREMVALPGHNGFVYSVVFNPIDGNLLASSGNDGWVRVWDVKAKRESLAQPLPGLKVGAVGMAYCVTFSPDGKFIAAASEADTVRVWDAATGARRYKLGGHTLQASCVAFSGDGRLLASGDWGGAVRIWEVKSGKLLKNLQTSERQWPVACIAFNPDPDGQLLAAGYFDGQVTVWDVASGKIHRQLAGHSGFLTSLAFHPRDARRLASAGEDRAVRIWDVPSGREILQLQGHIDNCSGLAFRPDGRLLASASYDQTIRLWDATLQPANQRHLVRTFDFGHKVWCIAISTDGQRVAAAGEGPNQILKILNTASGTAQEDFSSAFAGIVFNVAFSFDGRRLAAAGADTGTPPWVVKVLDVRTGRVDCELREAQEIFAAEFSCDGRWIALGLADGSVKLADARCGEVIAYVGKHDDPIVYGGLRFRRDGLRLASASLDGTARIWDLTSALLAVPAEGAPVIRSASDHLCLNMSSGNPAIALWSLSYSPDGGHLITGDKDGQLRLWDAENGAFIRGNSDAARRGSLSVAYSPNGRWIVSASEDCTVRVHDAGTLKLEGKFRGHLDRILCLAASDRFVATGGGDKTVRFWDLRNAGTRPSQLRP